MEERKNSEARIRANNKYNAKAYDRINIAVPKGKKTTIQAHADAQGQSVNGYINAAIDEKMERDGPVSPQGDTGPGVVSLHSEDGKAAQTAPDGQTEEV